MSSLVVVVVVVESPSRSGEIGMNVPRCGDGGEACMASKLRRDIFFCGVYSWERGGGGLT